MFLFSSREREREREGEARISFLSDPINETFMANKSVGNASDSSSNSFFCCSFVLSIFIQFFWLRLSDFEEVGFSTWK